VADDDWTQLSPVGAFIREQRRLVKLSQRQLARMTGLSDTYLSQLERGLHEPSVRALRAIARGLDVSAEQLISLTGALEEDLDAPSAASGGTSAAAGPAGPAGRAPAPVTTESAIRQDPRLSEAQKVALLAVLGSYLDANAAESTSAESTSAGAASAGAASASGADTGPVKDGPVGDGPAGPAGRRRRGSR